MKEEIEAAIKSRKPSQVREIYSKVFSRKLAQGCNSCIPDAIIELEIYLQNIILGESKINLFVNLYQSDNKERQKELDKCLELNEANEFINRIIPVPSRNYNDIFRQCVLYPNDVNIIANSDIFFNETIQHAKKIWKQYCYALTRWDYRKGQAVFMNRRDSQDVWIFRGVPKVNANFELGQAGCLSGSTKIKYKRGKRDGSREITLHQLFKNFNYLNKWWSEDATYVHSIHPQTGIVFYNRVNAVIESGIKKVIEITLEDGTKLKATSDHPISVGIDNYVEAGKLLIGEFVLCLGSMRSIASGNKRKYSKRKVVYIKYHPFAQTIRLKGKEYKRYTKARLVYEADMNELSFSEYMDKLNSGNVSGLNFLHPSFEIHHKDENSLNDSIDNLEALTKEQHARLHGGFKNVEYRKYKKIVKIEQRGEEMTYDIQMDAPAHNFVANGIFVHNCDNHLAYLIKKAGYVLRNPSLTIQAIHLHEVDYRTYKQSERIPEPYHFLDPCELK